MQDFAYIPWKPSDIPVLRRSTKYGVTLKLRKSAKPKGVRLEGEAAYLKQNYMAFSALISGETISC